MQREWMDGWMEGGRERRARGVSLLWQAKTAAVLKLQCSATVLQGCVCRHIEGGGGEIKGRDGEGGQGHAGGLVIFAC